jgi:hypothetical protein
MKRISLISHHTGLGNHPLGFIEINLLDALSLYGLSFFPQFQLSQKTHNLLERVIIAYNLIGPSKTRRRGLFE